jgi:hypothetical protein
VNEQVVIPARHHEVTVLGSTLGLVLELDVPVDARPLVAATFPPGIVTALLSSMIRVQGVLLPVPLGNWRRDPSLDEHRHR